MMKKNNPCYCINLRRAANNMTKFYDQALSSTNLTVSQFSLLNDLSVLQTCNTRDLADYAKLDRSTITRNIKILKNKGLVVDLSANDTKNSILKVTDLGLKKLNECYIYWAQAQRAVQDSMGFENIEILMQTLNRLEKL